MVNKILYVLSNRERWALGFIFVLIAAGSVLELMGVGIFMPFIQVLTDPSVIRTDGRLCWLYERFSFRNTTDFLASLSLAIILIYIIKNVFIIWEKNFIYKYSYRVQQRVSVRLLTAYMHEPYTFYLNKNIAELQRGLVTDTDYFSKAIIHALELLTEVLVCIVLGIYLFLVSHSITVVILGILVLTVLFFAFVSKKITTRKGRESQQDMSRLIQKVNESLGGIKEVRILGREKSFIDRYDRILAHYVRCLRIVRIMGEMPKYVVEAGCMCGMLLAVIIKLYFGGNEMQTFIPQLGVFAVAAFRLLPSVGRISEHLNSVMNSIPSVNVIYHDIREVEELQADRGTPDSSWRLKNGIRIEHVTFAYPDAESNVLDDVCLEIPKGKTIALIGSSGSGKTTLADLILGLLSPQRGHILADELDIAKNVRTWQQEIGYIPQTIYLSDDTIRNNIAFGIPADEIHEDAVREAAHKAQLDDFIETLPDGLDTVVGDRGARLSGGQRQRIGIARALYNDPEVLVLDEATSALDNDTETAVMEAVDELHGKKTILIIAHRLSTIRNADLIFEVTGGKAVPRDKAEVLAGIVPAGEEEAEHGPCEDSTEIGAFHEF